MVIVGFDWARDKHDVCIQNMEGRVLYATQVAHGPEALDALSEQIAALEPERASVTESARAPGRGSPLYAARRRCLSLPEGKRHSAWRSA